MEIRAAVARHANRAFSIERADLEAPRNNEVLVKIHGVGLCHTDLIARSQFIPIPLPAVLGHEGAGTVVAVGSATGSFWGFRAVVPVRAVLKTCHRIVGTFRH
jgi:aryl-alcohol dehydrogenase